jgi:alginate O-acetyltransferase complex protein AlgJ
MPAPVKPMIEPEHLSSRYQPPLPIPLQNPDYQAFLDRLKAANVDVIDISGAVAQAKQQTGQRQFLLTDTHWTPETMEMAARLLAQKIEALSLLNGPNLDLQTSTETISNVGDIANMLKLPSYSHLYPPETATIHPVAKADGTPWATDPSAQILFLGDSFSNIYSLAPMGWGASAGLVEHVSYNLRQPVDTILRNDAGAHATRDLLARDIAMGHDRLAGKKILVWEFAMRELSVGDWKLVDLPQAPPVAATPTPAAAGAPQFFVPSDGAPPVRVTAVVREVSNVPRPGTVPYKDQVFAVHLAELSGPGISGGSEAVVYLFGMKDNVLTPAAQWKPDDHVTLTLRSWNDVSDRYDRLNRSELDNTDLQLQAPCWGEPAN